MKEAQHELTRLLSLGHYFTLRGSYGLFHLKFLQKPIIYDFPSKKEHICNFQFSLCTLKTPWKKTLNRVPTWSHFPRKSHFFKSPWNGPIIVPFLPKSFLGPIIVPFYTMGSSREFSYPLFLDDPVLFFVTLYYLLLRDLTRCYRHLQILLKAAL